MEYFIIKWTFATIRKREDFGYELHFLTGDDAGNKIYAWCTEVNQKCILKTYDYEDEHFDISIHEFDKKISQVSENFVDVNSLIIKAKRLTQFNHNKSITLNIKEM